jgi:hypothetical protein
LRFSAALEVRTEVSQTATGKIAKTVCRTKSATLFKHEFLVCSGDVDHLIGLLNGSLFG